MNRRQNLFIRTPYGEPLHIARAQGAYLFTRDGQRILDAASGAIVVNIGQGREELAKVAAEQIARLDYVLPVWETPELERLVDRLAGWTPEGIDRFFFTSGGSEAVEAAIKFALFYNRTKGRPRKNLIVSRWVSYHGNTLATLSAGGNVARRRDYEGTLFDWPKLPPSYCYRCPWGKTYPGCGLECAEALEEAVTQHGAERIAAFIAEPVVGASGAVIAPVPEYFPRIAEICRKHDILLIADEVMTGFGRTGKRFAVEHFDVRPDILVGGKGLAGGYAPMGVMAADRRLVEECEDIGGVFMFYTFTAHPLACVLAERVLEIMEREKLVERAAREGANLGRKLRETLGDHPLVGDIRGMGMFWGVELVADRASRRPLAPSAGVVNRILHANLRRGLFCYPAGGMAYPQAGGDGFIVAPPLIVGNEEIEFIGRVLRESLDEVAAALKAAGASESQ